MDTLTRMPIKVPPYKHQQEAWSPAVHNPQQRRGTAHGNGYRKNANRHRYHRSVASQWKNPTSSCGFATVHHHRLARGICQVC